MSDPLSGCSPRRPQVSGGQRPKVAWVAVLAWLAWMTWLRAFALAQAQPVLVQAKPVPGHSLFSGGTVRTLRIQLPPGALESLR